MDINTIKKIYETFEVPIIVYKGIKKICQYPLENCYQLFEQNQKMLVYIQEIADSREFPFLLLEDKNIFYGIFKDQSGNLFAFGPVTMQRTEHKPCFSCKGTLKQVSMQQMSKILVLVVFLVSGMDIEAKCIQIANCNEKIVKWSTTEESMYQQLKQSELEYDHNSMEYENRLLQIVEKGDVEAMYKLILGEGMLEDEHIGEVAVDELKRMEYLTVTLITLLSRTAIRGGVAYEESCELSDVFLRKLEKCKTIEEMLSLSSRAQIEYTKKVKSAKAANSGIPYIERCKIFINKSLHKSIKVGEIAPAIGMSKSYLARKFMEEEGLTIQQYIMKERCIHAADMLKFTDYPISIVSEYFCFSSQSHFGRQFKEYFGMTPKEYRNQNQKNVVTDEKKYQEAKKGVFVL